jgi:uncharacterized protein
MLYLILIIVFTLGLSLFASWRVKRVYNKYVQIPARSGATGAQAASAILRSAGIHDVEIAEQDGMLSDHYDPRNKRLVLSSMNYHGRSLAALGVAAHECGHAIQHKEAYAPLHWRMAAVGITGIASQLTMWLPILGVATGILEKFTGALILAVAWGILMLFQMITLPVEFDASRRAKAVLGNMGFISPGEEMTGVRRTLDAAAWTYIAAFITTLIYFIWHLLPLLTGRREEETTHHTNYELPKMLRRPLHLRPSGGGN